MTNADKLREISARILTEGSISADLVKEWLSLKRLPYAWLAQAMGVSESTIKNWLSTTQIIPEHRQGAIREIVQRKNFSDNIFLENKFVPQPTGSDSDDASDYCEKRLEVPKDPNEDVIYRLPRQLYEMLYMIGRTQRKSVQQLTNEILYRWVAQAYPEAAHSSERKQPARIRRLDVETRLCELDREQRQIEKKIVIVRENKARHEQEFNSLNRHLAELKMAAQKFQDSRMYEEIINLPQMKCQATELHLRELSRKLEMYLRRRAELEKEIHDLMEMMRELPD